ncbi:MAG: ATP-binding protein [Candidatus Cloacimonetes bacterium]|nr:ATP-binding protein [Candidatus Cloacimonadota bacterium]
MLLEFKKAIIKKNKLLILCISIIITLSALFYIDYIIKQADSELKNELLIQSKILRNSLNIQDILKLTGTTNDYDNPSYLKTQKQISNIFSANEKYIYIYLMGRDEQTQSIYYLVDGINSSIEENEPEIPGKIYEEATSELIEVFDTGIAFIEGPVEDEWGIWVSSIIPIFHPETNKVIAVLGIDIDAGEWKWILTNRVISPIALMILLLVILYFLFIILQSKKELSDRETRIYKQRTAITSFLLDENFTHQDLNIIYNNINKTIAETLNADIVSIWLFSNDNKYLISQSIYRKYESKFHKTTKLDIEDIPNFLKSIKNKDILSITDTHNNPAVSDLLETHIKINNISSLIDACIYVDGKLIGLLCIEIKNTKRYWTQDEENFVNTASTVVSQLISQQKNKIIEANFHDTYKALITTLESMTDGFMSVDFDCNLKYVNRHASNMLFSNNQFKIGECIKNYISQPFLKDIENKLIDCLQKKSTSTFILFYKEKNKWLEFRTYPNKEGLSIFFQDITEKKQAEKAVLESQRLSAIGEMSNAISHDFNNYLQIISGSIEIIEKKQTFTKEVKEYIEKIKLSSIDAATRVKLIQRFTGTINIENKYSVIDINETINDAILQTQPIWKNSAESKGISININFNKENIKNIKGNNSELRTVFFNVIKNSIDAMPKGGDITFQTYMKEDKAFIKISDTGIGMDLQTQERVFQPMFTTKGFDLGKGFGLSSAYSILNEHGGNIKIAESTLNQGTTIEISLPTTDEQTPEQENNQNTILDNKVKILWVDDDNMIGQIISDMAEILGYDIKIFDNAYDALDSIKINTYDIIFTDIGMPGMNGWQFLDKINELYQGKFKVGIVSGWGDQIKDEDKKNHTFDFIFTKPIKMNELKKLINNLTS